MSISAALKLKYQALPSLRKVSLTGVSVLVETTLGYSLCHSPPI